MRQLQAMRLVSLVSTNTGVMLNLVTNDTQKVVDAATFFHHGEGSHANFISSIILNPSNFTIRTDERRIVAILKNHVSLQNSCFGGEFRLKFDILECSRIV